MLGFDAEILQTNPELMLRTIDPRDRRNGFRHAIATSRAKDLSSYEDREMRNVTVSGEGALGALDSRRTTKLDDGSYRCGNGPHFSDITDRRSGPEETGSGGIDAACLSSIERSSPEGDRDLRCRGTVWCCANERYRAIIAARAGQVSRARCALRGF